MLRSCLESIEKNLSDILAYEVFVVDNASTDGTVEWLKNESRHNERLKILLNSENVGFARANNQALKECRGEFILLLNNDAYLVDSSILRGIEYLRGHPHAFGCGGLLLNPDGDRGISYGHFPSTHTLMREIVKCGYGSLRAVTPDETEDIHPIDFPCGAYFLVQARLLESVGLMDERFFLYFEETDWALRAWNRGYGVYYLPACRAVHMGGEFIRTSSAAVDHCHFLRKLVPFI